VNAPGLSSNAFWSNQTWIGTWEMFELEPVWGSIDQFAIQTIGDRPSTSSGWVFAASHASPGIRLPVRFALAPDQR
jgi:hypothetical protein